MAAPTTPAPTPDSEWLENREIPGYPAGQNPYDPADRWAGQFGGTNPGNYPGASTYNPRFPAGPFPGGVPPAGWNNKNPGAGVPVGAAPTAPTSPTVPPPPGGPLTGGTDTQDPFAGKGPGNYPGASTYNPLFPTGPFPGGLPPDGWNNKNPGAGVPPGYPGSPPGAPISPPPGAPARPDVPPPDDTQVPGPGYPFGGYPGGPPTTVPGASPPAQPPGNTAPGNGNNQPPTGQPGIIGTNVTPTAATATAVGYSPTPRVVDPTTETVAGQINRLLQEDSLYMQQARAGAMQTANARGLLNTSLAAGAGEDAAIKSALPIAGSDAATYSTAARENQAAGNQAAQFGAQAENQVRALNATEVNQLTKIGYQGQIEKDLQNLRGAQAKDVAELQSLTQKAVAGIQAETQTGIAQMEVDQKLRSQTLESAGYAFQQGVQEINKILLNPDMDIATKQAAVDRQVTLMRVGIAMIGRLGGISTEDILQFYDEVNRGVYTGGPGLAPLPGGAPQATPTASPGSPAWITQVSDPASPYYNQNDPYYDPYQDRNSQEFKGQ